MGIAARPSDLPKHLIRGPTGNIPSDLRKLLIDRLQGDVARRKDEQKSPSTGGPPHSIVHLTAVGVSQLLGGLLTTSYMYSRSEITLMIRNFKYLSALEQCFTGDLQLYYIIFKKRS